MPVTTHTYSSARRTASESRLRSLRRDRGLTGEELAAKAGLSLRTVYAIETNDVRPQRATRRVIALALGCKVEDVFPKNESGPAGKPSLTKTAGGISHDEQYGH